MGGVKCFNVRDKKSGLTETNLSEPGLTSFSCFARRYLDTRGRKAKIL